MKSNRQTLCLNVFIFANQLVFYLVLFLIIKKSTGVTPVLKSQNVWHTFKNSEGSTLSKPCGMRFGWISQFCTLPLPTKQFPFTQNLHRIATETTL